MYQDLIIENDSYDKKGEFMKQFVQHREQHESGMPGGGKQKG